MSLDDLVGGPRRSDPRPVTARGAVVRTPASNSESLFVRLLNFSSDYHFEVPPGQWAAASPLPAAGSRCIVIFDDDGDAWVPGFGGVVGAAGAAGGDLSGSYPNPQIATGSIVNADVSASAAIAESKLALASDAAAGTASRRSLGTGALQAAAGDHTHTALTAQASRFEHFGNGGGSLGLPNNSGTVRVPKSGGGDMGSGVTFPAYTVWLVHAHFLVSANSANWTEAFVNVNAYNAGTAGFVGALMTVRAVVNSAASAGAGGWVTVAASRLFSIGADPYFVRIDAGCHGSFGGFLWQGVEHCQWTGQRIV